MKKQEVVCLSIHYGCVVWLAIGEVFIVYQPTQWPGQCCGCSRYHSSDSLAKFRWPPTLPSGSAAGDIYCFGLCHVGVLEPDVTLYWPKVDVPIYQLLLVGLVVVLYSVFCGLILKSFFMQQSFVSLVQLQNKKACYCWCYVNETKTKSKNMMTLKCGIRSR